MGSTQGAKKMEDRDRRLKAFPTTDWIMLIIFLRFFFRFWSSLVGLGSLLGSLEALLGSLWTQKHVKTNCFLMVLKRLFLGL